MTSSSPPAAAVKSPAVPVGPSLSWMPLGAGVAAGLGIYAPGGPPPVGAGAAAPTPTRGSPSGEAPRASRAIRSLRAQIRYAAMKGIAKPWERFGNAAHSATKGGTTGA